MTLRIHRNTHSAKNKGIIYGLARAYDELTWDQRHQGFELLSLSPEEIKQASGYTLIERIHSAATTQFHPLDGRPLAGKSYIRLPRS